jgi:hypothetical protein
MATYNLAFHTRLDGVVVLQTFVDTDIQVQDSVTIAGASHDLNGTYTVISNEPYEYLGQDDEGDLRFDYNIIRENQFLFLDAGTDLERSVATGTVATTSTACTWITSADVLSWLGIATATANDTAFVTVCTDAANALAFRRRRAAGYFSDVLATAPSADVKLGTTMMAAQLYRSRGSAGGDSFQSYESLASGNNPVAMGDILRLWGCNRAQVA